MCVTMVCTTICMLLYTAQILRHMMWLCHWLVCHVGGKWMDGCRCCWVLGLRHLVHCCHTSYNRCDSWYRGCIN